VDPMQVIPTSYNRGETPGNDEPRIPAFLNDSGYSSNFRKHFGLLTVQIVVNTTPDGPSYQE
jgi:hypothetical protein